MTTERDPRTRLVLSWLREDGHENAERVLLAALDVVDTTPQRRSWWPARRFTQMNAYTKLGLAAAATVVVAVAASQLLPRSITDPGKPSPAPSSSADIDPTAEPVLPTLGNGEVPAGPYAWYWSGPPITFEVPDGWTGGAWITKHGDTPATLDFDRWLPDNTIINVYTDACRSEGALEPFGGTVDGLVSALDAQVSSDATISDVNLGGRPAIRVDLTASAGIDMADCRNGPGTPIQIWANPAETDYFAFVLDERAVVHVVDIDGALVVFTSVIGPDASAADIAELDGIVASVEFDETATSPSP